MLTDPTIGIDRRALLVGRRLGAGIGLRVALAAVAVLYVVGPTLLQWVALDRERAITRGEVWAVEADRPPEVTTGRRSAAGQPLVVPLAPHVPESWRHYVPLALAALTGRGEGVSSRPATVLGATARAIVLVAAAWISVMVGGRLAWRLYRPKHARRSGRFGILR